MRSEAKKAASLYDIEKHDKIVIFDSHNAIVCESTPDWTNTHTDVFVKIIV